MTQKSKLLLLVAIVVAALGSGAYLWWNSPVRAATRALLSLVDTLQIDGDESQISRQGKAARLGRAVTDPVDIKLQEAGRDGAWSAESLQTRYAAGAMAATSATIKLENPEAEESEDGNVLVTATLVASYSGSGTTSRNINRPCRWIMTLENGNWVISSFRETESAE